MTPSEAKRENIRRCMEQARLGHSDDALRLMHFADGCIMEARRFIDVEADEFGANNGPMTRPGDKEFDL